MAETTNAPAASRSCATTGCGKPASMQCPNCIKLGVTEGSFFCSQDCFKSSWEQHKAVHKKAKEEAALNSGPMNCWPGFEFTGLMRPYPKTGRRTLPAKIVRPDYAETGIPKSEIKNRQSTIARCLDDEEQETMRVVCKLGREVLDEGARAIAVGVTTDELDRIIHEACIERECYPSPLNYHNFPKSCCTSVNEVICHGIPDMYKLQNKDIVNLDVSVFKHGHHADLNETYFVGDVDEESRKLVKTTYECLEQAIAACKPGFRYRDIGDIISKHAHANGFQVVRTYCGHGVNDLFHTVPSIPHYAKNKAVGFMKVGHTFTIEPMINAGNWKDVTWPDEWTSTTIDGRRSAQFEHTLLIVEGGCEVLTRRLPTSPAGSIWFQTAS
eukprot:m.63883 g.63883  ORF g.63883 m.63883 type:complete len:384 (+) comp13885_c0_seq1:51-1202(+)